MSQYLQTHCAKHYTGAYRSVSDAEICNISVLITKHFSRFVLNAALRTFVHGNFALTTTENTVTWPLQKKDAIRVPINFQRLQMVTSSKHLDVSNLFYNLH